MKIHTIGIDLGKTKFHIVGLNERGEVVVRKKFSRAQLLRFTANRKVHLIGMEACGGSHFLGRLLQGQRHEVRLIPAQYVKPYVKTDRSDYIDAEAIAEAVGCHRFCSSEVRRIVALPLATIARASTIGGVGMLPPPPSVSSACRAS